MIKKFAAVLTAGIIFLTTPTFAQADEDFSDEPTVDAPFAKLEPPPLDEDEKNIQPPDNQKQPIEPQPTSRNKLSNRNQFPTRDRNRLKNRCPNPLSSRRPSKRKAWSFWFITKMA